jgi:5'/3'-nucleotidase
MEEHRVDARRTKHLVAAALVAAVVAAGCGGGDSEPPTVTQSGVRETTTTASTTTTTAAGDAAAPLKIVVTNDDGFSAAGIDKLVSALAAVDGVEVTVVAPATQQSGTGGKATDGPLTTTPQKLASGEDVTAVTGFPADTIRVAFDDMKLEPDLVISGINEGQNLGPLVDVSGTVGAARAAVRRGVPALAVSQGRGQTFDYDVAADLVVQWLAENRAAVADGSLPTDFVFNLNVPSCDTGELRGSLDVESGTTGNPAAVADCTATGTGFTDDVTAFNSGYATLTHVPVEPAA